LEGVRRYRWKALKIEGGKNGRCEVEQVRSERDRGWDDGKVRRAEGRMKMDERIKVKWLIKLNS